MRPLDFVPNLIPNKTPETFTVPGPDMIREKLIPLNEEGAAQMETRLGVRPARASLSRWRIYGYPVDRNGPRVLLPYTVRMKNVFTSSAALARWFKACQLLGESIQAAGGVKKWRESGGARTWQNQVAEACTSG